MVLVLESQQGGEGVTYLENEMTDEEILQIVGNRADIGDAVRIARAVEAKIEMLEAMLSGDGALITGLKDDVKQLTAENARLRDALERIAGYSMSQFPNRTAMIIEMHHVANDALGIKRGE